MHSTAVSTFQPEEAGIPFRALNEAGRREYLALYFAEHFLGNERFDRYLGGARDRNLSRLEAYFRDWPTKERRPVPEVQFTTHEAFYREFPASWEPAVFRGVARNWKAVQTWDLDYFADNFADTKAILGDQHGLFGESETGEYAQTTLGKIVAAMRAGENQCLRFSPIIDENPQLKDDLDMEWLAGFRSRFSVRGVPQFFLAPQSIYTPLHCALECNAFIQIYGKKRWLLYPAMYQPLLGVPVTRRPYFYSEYHPDRFNPAYELADHAPAYEVVLEPGDVMYIPPFVWHHVENVTPTIAIGYRFNNLRHAFRSSWAQTLLRFLATKPSVLQTLYYSLTNTNFLYKPKVD